MFEKYTVKVLRVSTGERFVLIISKRTAIPHAVSSNYLLVRKNVVSMNTLKKEANAICLLLNWSESSADAGIIEFLESTQKKNIHGLWLHLKKSKLKKSVAPGTHAYRWMVIQNYIKFLSDKSIGNLSYEDPSFKSLCEKRDILLRQMKVLNVRPRAKRKKGLPKQWEFRIRQNVPQSLNITSQIVAQIFTGIIKLLLRLRQMWMEIDLRLYIMMAIIMLKNQVTPPLLRKSISGGVLWEHRVSKLDGVRAAS